MNMEPNSGDKAPRDWSESGEQGERPDGENYLAPPENQQDQQDYASDASSSEAAGDDSAGFTPASYDTYNSQKTSPKSRPRRYSIRDWQGKALAGGAVVVGGVVGIGGIYFTGGGDGGSEVAMPTSQSGAQTPGPQNSQKPKNDSEKPKNISAQDVIKFVNIDLCQKPYGESIAKQLAAVSQIDLDCSGPLAPESSGSAMDAEGDTTFSVLGNDIARVAIRKFNPAKDGKLGGDGLSTQGNVVSGPVSIKVNGQNIDCNYGANNDPSLIQPNGTPRVDASNMACFYDKDGQKFVVSANIVTSVVDVYKSFMKGVINVLDESSIPPKASDRADRTVSVH